MIRRPSSVSRPTAVEIPLDVRGLRGYQAEGAAWLRARARAGRGALLGDEMGLGKTAQALRALPARARGIVACPASVAMVWRDEARRWRPDLRVSVRDRLEGRPAEGALLVASYDALPEEDPRSKGVVADDLSEVILILDEAHRAKEEGALRTRLARRLARQCRSVWGLTGTPMVGTPRDLEGVLVTIGVFLEAFPGGRAEFDALCRASRRGGRGRVHDLWEEDVSPEVRERLGRVMLRRRLREQTELPPETWIDVPCPAPEDLRDHLDRITEAWDRYDPAGLPPFELYSAATAALARSRASMVRDLAADASRARPTLVFSAHLAPVDAAATLPGAVRIAGEEPAAERERSVAAFRQGRARVLAATYGAGGVGLNLPEAGAAILADLPYTPGDVDQAIGRARGAVAHGGLLVYRMTSDHPLDVRIRAIVEGKRRIIGQAVDGEATEAGT